MAFPEKGSRKIVVDDEVYRWNFPRRVTQLEDDGWPGIAASVQLFDRGESVLFVWFSQRYRPMKGLPSLAERFAKPITPSEIAASIKFAIADGWQPHQRGQNQTVLVEDSPEFHIKRVDETKDYWKETRPEVV